MAKGSSYIIDDEPATSGPLQRFIVDPMHPLLAVMMAGVWLGWPWMVLNGRALGSPNWRRQARLVAIGLAGAALLAVAIVFLWEQEVIRTRTHVQVALLVVTVWKLGVSYKVHALQSETFELHRYYGGEVKDGWRVVLLGAYLGRALVLGLFDSALWVIIISGGLVFSSDVTTITGGP
jgi:hypothetical protein